MKPTKRSGISLLSCIILIVCLGVIGLGVHYVAKKAVNKSKSISNIRDHKLSNHLYRACQKFTDYPWLVTQTNFASESEFTNWINSIQLWEMEESTNGMQWRQVGGPWWADPATIQGMCEDRRDFALTNYSDIVPTYFVAPREVVE